MNGKWILTPYKVDRSKSNCSLSKKKKKTTPKPTPCLPFQHSHCVSTHKIKLRPLSKKPHLKIPSQFISFILHKKTPGETELRSTANCHTASLSVNRKKLLPLLQKILSLTRSSRTGLFFWESTDSVCLFHKLGTNVEPICSSENNPNKKAILRQALGFFIKSNHRK